jgi:antitoxin CptB
LAAGAADKPGLRPYKGSCAGGIRSGAFCVDFGGKMSGTTRSSEGLDPRRRRILFRCWHRGMREVDLLLGQFADARIDQLSEDELDQLEHFMEAQDVDIFSWFAGSKPVDPDYARPIFETIKAFHTHNGPINV